METEKERVFEEEEEDERESGTIYRSQLWKLTELEFAEWPFAVVALFESSDSVKFCLISEDKKERGEPGASKNYFYSWWIRVKMTFRTILGLKYHLYSHIAPVVYATDSLIHQTVSKGKRNISHNTLFGRSSLPSHDT